MSALLLVLDQSYILKQDTFNVVARKYRLTAAKMISTDMHLHMDPYATQLIYTTRLQGNTTLLLIFID